MHSHRYTSGVKIKQGSYNPLANVDTCLHTCLHTTCLRKYAVEDDDGSPTTPVFGKAIEHHARLCRDLHSLLPRDHAGRHGILPLGASEDQGWIQVLKIVGHVV